MRALWSKVRKPFAAVGRFVGRWLGRLHRALLASAVPFGVREAAWWRRWGLFVLSFGGVFLLAVFAPWWLALPAVGFGLWGVVAVSRAWAENEDRRRRIAKKIDDGTATADDLPDLRGVALTASLASLVLLPLFAERLHEGFGLYRPDPGVTYWNWLWFLADKTYLKSVPDVSEVVRIHNTGVAFGHPAGEYVIILSRLLVYYFVLQTVYRLYDIHQDVTDAVRAVGRDPDLAVRVGRRAVDRLIRRFEDGSGTSGDRAGAAVALGRLNDPAGYEALAAAAEAADTPDGLRRQAVLALGGFPHPDAVGVLTRLLDREDVKVQQAAAVALGNVKADAETEADGAAVAALLVKLRTLRGQPKADYDTLKRVVEAVGVRLAGRPDDPRTAAALDLILRPPSLAEHPSLRVQNRTATALGRLAHPRGVIPLVEMLDRNTNAKLLGTAAAALGPLAARLPADHPDRKAAVRICTRGLVESDNDSVQAAVAHALGAMREAAALPALYRALEEALRDDRTWLRGELVKVFEGFGEGVKRKADDAVKEFNQVRTRTLVGRLMNPQLSADARCEAADQLTERSGRQAVNAIRILYLEGDTPAAVKERLLAAARRIDPEQADELAMLAAQPPSKR